MIRRTFIHKFSFALSIGALFPFNVLSKNKFKLNYAPHLGMFKNNVGDDPIDQINYMKLAVYTWLLILLDNIMFSADPNLEDEEYEMSSRIDGIDEDVLV